MSTIQKGWAGFEAHKGPLLFPKQCDDGTWTYKQGSLLRWKGLAYSLEVQGLGTVVGMASAPLGAHTKWIVQMSKEDAPLFLPGGFHVTVFSAYDLRPVGM